MRSEWKTKALGDLVTFSSGGTPSKQNPSYWGGNIPWISAKTMKSERISSSDLMITEEGLAAGSRMAPVESILLLTRGSGLFKGIPICLVERPVAYNQDVKCLEAQPGVNIRFIYYWLKSQEPFLKARLEVTGIGAGKFDTKLLSELAVPLPNQIEQSKIVSFADAISEKIIANKQINDHLEQQAMALYRQTFVENNNDARRECRADEYFDISIGKTPPRKEAQWFSMNPTNCIWVSISDMGRCGMYIADSSEYLTHESVDKFNIKVVPDNTVLLSFKLTVGRVAITDGAMVTNEAIAHFKTDKPEINEYLYCYLKDFNYQTMGSTSSIATAVNSKIIKAMPFVIPTDAELVSFHSATAPMFEMIKTRQRENTRLAELRDSLLPKLMSGEIDVSAVQL